MCIRDRYGEGGARRIVSGGDDGVSVFDADAGGEPLQKIDAGYVSAVTIYGEGDARRIVSGGWQTKLLLWDVVEGGAPLREFEGAGNVIRSRATARATGGTS